MRVFPDLTVDREFQELGSRGFFGTLNDRQFNYLRSLGRTGSLPDMFNSDAPSPVVLSLGGTSVTFSAGGLVGTHFDGTPWVVLGNASEISNQSPAAAAVNRSGSFTGSPIVAQTHGMEFAPGRASVQDTLENMQTTNNGIETEQGYDELVPSASNAAYDTGRAVANGTVAQAGVYVKSLGLLSGINSSGRPTVDEMGAFTAYTTPPGSNKFRPPFAGDGTPVGYGPDDLDLSSLLNLDASGYTGAFPTYSQALELLTDRVNTEQKTYNVLTRNIITDGPSYDGLNADVYAGSYYEAVANIALALNFDFYTAAEKRALASHIVQTAIDYVGRADQGGIWQDNGGHCHGRQEVVALAAIWTNGTGDTRFSDALAYTTTLFTDPAGTASIWGSDRQYFVISQNDIDRVRTQPYTQGQLGTPEWSGDATRKDADTAGGASQRFNTLGVTSDPGYGNNSGYRHIITKAAAPFALALRMLGGVSTRGNQSWFDYQDRHMQVRIDAGAALPDASGNDLHPFALWAWENHRANYGALWSAPELAVDPGFDTPSDWDTPAGHSITGSQLVISGAAANSSTFNAQGTDIDVTGLSVVDYTFSIASGSAGDRIRFELRWYDSGGTLISSSRVPTSTVTLTGGAQVVSGTVIPPTNSAALEMRFQAIDAGMSIAIDNYSIQSG